MDSSSRVSNYRYRRHGGGSDGVSTPRRATTPSRAGSFGRQMSLGGQHGGGGHVTHYDGNSMISGGDRNFDGVNASLNGHSINNANNNSAPNDLTTYILELEAQNRELRQHITALQSQLSAANAARSASMAHAATEGRLREVMGDEGAKAVTSTINSSTNKSLGTEAERRAFLTDILSQIEVVIQAHRNKSQSEISRYKAEAESAREALKALREVIQKEGMDLTLAPGLLNTQKALGLGGNSYASMLRADAADLALPSDCESLLNGISQDMLRRLVALDDTNDLAHAVKEEVKRGFTVVVKHFAQQMVMAANDSAAALADQRADNDRMRDELRTQLHMSEERRLQMVREHDIEVTALRDELHAFNIAASDDDIERNLHQRALEEYNRMLVDARMETAALRKNLEDEKNHSAEVCLRLKSALQRRSAEFEKTIVEQAEALVKDRDTTIGHLRQEISVLKGPPKTYSSLACQAGESFVVPVDADNYVNNVLRTMKRDPKSVGESTEQYERDLWRHTQELIQRYGGVLPPSSTSHGQGGANNNASSHNTSSHLRR